ncbi:MAG: nucleotide sugar dehydrogenase [Parasphingorhabdus sp.]|uniref:nucleotide sugar dehydrogenase n=1 Tax=Parasphingorhabdus sp. TaxID=2709688 RepID=UPI003262FB5B
MSELSETCETLVEKIDARRAVVGIIGLGYVGLPLSVATAAKGYDVLGFDVDPTKIVSLNAGNSYIDAVPSAKLSKLVDQNKFFATSDFDKLAECDIIIICVPTPLSQQREPDLGFVITTANDILQRLRPGQAIVLESTTFPGTTEEVLKTILEQGGLKSGVDFFLGFSPEREDPGNATYHTETIPKVVAGDGEQALLVLTKFYDSVVDQVVPVSTPATAEAVKITENVFRAVNIALVNELKLIFEKMDVDVWEVIDAAATKPFGFMRFTPGPGLGGHCIPIDPFYLSWKAREYGMTTRFIELAGEINVAMPQYVVSRMVDALSEKLGLAASKARVLIVGIAYKKNVNDMRESPALALIDLLEAKGTTTDYFDPHVPEIPPTREHQQLAGRKSINLSSDTIKNYDAVLIATDHDAVDYAMVVQNSNLIVDTRNIIAKHALSMTNVVKA